MWEIIGAVVAALISAGTAIYKNNQQKKLNAQLTGAQVEQNQFNAGEAQKSRDFTEFMQRNKYQMETESMQEAGVNPAMVYGGGNLVSGVSSGAVASGQGSGNAGISDLTSLIEPMMALMRMPMEMAKMKAETKQIQTETEGFQLQNYITEGTKDSIIKLTNMAPDERQATIDNIIAKTKNEDITAQILGVQVLQSKLDYEQNKRMNDLIFDMQKMQNEYQDFVNKHQEKQWEIEYKKTCSEITELWTRAKKNMSDIEVNNADIGLKSAMTGLTKAQTTTEGFKQNSIAVDTWKNFYDPKAHITRSVVDPMDKIHSIISGLHDEGKQNVLGGLKGFWNDTKNQYVKGYTEAYGDNSYNESIEAQAEAIATMFSTYGQAFEEYGDIR